MCRRIQIAFFVLALLLPISVFAQRRSEPGARWTATSDALVFGDRNWVYYLAPNSTTPRRLAKGNFPALSPDGKRVA